MIGPSGLEQEPRDHGGCHCYRQFAKETFVSLWYFALFVIVGYRAKIVNMGGWFILLRLSSSEMLFCRCHLFRLELWCFWMSCHLCFVLLFVILFVGNWGQRALRKEADRGEQYHNHEDGDRRGNNIILMRKEAERAGDHHLWTSSSWGEATITPSTGVWQNMWRRINRAPPVLGTSTSSSHWGWQIEHGSACTSRKQGNGKRLYFQKKRITLM